MSFSANSGQTFEKLGYWLRLIVGSRTTLCAFFSLTRLADRDTKIVQAFRHFMVCRGYRPPRRLSLNVIYIPLLHYGRVLRSMPRLAGNTALSDVEDLESKRLEFLSACEGTVGDYLGPGTARDLQGELIRKLFVSGFNLNLTEGQVSAFSTYAESTFLIRDLLDYCRRGWGMSGPNARAQLSEAIREFEVALRNHFSLSRAAPVTEGWQRAEQPLRHRLRQLCRQGCAMVPFYDRRRTLTGSRHYRSAPIWVLEQLDEHFRLVQDLSILDFQTELTHEMHLRSCALLCGVASVAMDGGPAVNEISLEFAESLRRLRKNLLRAVGSSGAGASIPWASLLTDAKSVPRDGRPGS